MNLRTVETKDYEETIRHCWLADPDIKKFSRNCEHDLDERLKREMASIGNTDKSFKFLKIYNDDIFVGYFGIENSTIYYLTTIFIMPEFRKNKDEIWDFVVSHFPDKFYSGLFAINTRAISFFVKKGAIKVLETTVENKPSILFEFKR